MSLSIHDLIGSSKQSSDLKSHHVRSRYNQNNGTLASENNFCRITLPKFPNEYADMNTLFLRFTLETAGPVGRRIDSLNVGSIFNRIVVKNGSNVLMDVHNYHIWCANEENIFSSKTGESSMDRFLRGHGSASERDEWSSAPREYMVAIGPRNSVIRGKHLLPLSSMSDFHIELFTSNGNDIFYTPSGGDCSFLLSNIETHCTYLSSSSIRDYFANSPPKFHLTDYSHRFNNVNSRTSLLKLPSSNTSLNTVFSLIHGARVVGSTDQLTTGILGTSVAGCQIFVNSTPLYDQEIDSLEQSWRHVVQAFPQACGSEWFDEGFKDRKYLQVTNLTSAPSNFQNQLVSGVRTSSLNSEIVIQLKFHSDPPAQLVADSFLLSDVVCQLVGGELQIRY